MKRTEVSGVILTFTNALIFLFNLVFEAPQREMIHLLILLLYRYDGLLDGQGLLMVHGMEGFSCIHQILVDLHRHRLRLQVLLSLRLCDSLQLL